MPSIAFNLIMILGLTLSTKPPSKDYELYWSDEFDGKELDMNNWSYRSLGTRRDATCPLFWVQ